MIVKPKIIKTHTPRTAHSQTTTKNKKKGDKLCQHQSKNQSKKLSKTKLQQ
ncbi:hypothetical Protein pso3_06080 [Candidatus Phytoplasma solani]